MAFEMMNISGARYSLSDFITDGTNIEIFDTEEEIEPPKQRTVPDFNAISPLTTGGVAADNKLIETMKEIQKWNKNVPESTHEKVDDEARIKRPIRKEPESRVIDPSVGLSIKIRGQSTPVEFQEMYVEKSGKWYSIVGSSETPADCRELMRKNLTEGVHCKVRFFDGVRVYIAEGAITKHEPTDFYTYFVLNISRTATLFIVNTRKCE